MDKEKVEKLMEGSVLMPYRPEDYRPIEIPEMRRVVLCKDCIHYLIHTNGKGVCRMLDTETRHDFYCGYGGRG